MFKELFYLIFVFIRKLPFVRTPALSSFVYICLLIGFNITTVYIVVFYFLDISLANKNIDSTFWGVLFGSIVMIINYFTLFSKRKIIFEEYSRRSKKRKIIGAVFWTVYVILSLTIFYVVAKTFLPWW